MEVGLRAYLSILKKYTKRTTEGSEMKKITEKLKEITEKGRQEIVGKVDEKLLEEKVNPTLPLHKGGDVPPATPGAK